MDPPSIQRFEIIERLGSGGAGTVYRARDPHLERDVAIKVLADRPAVAAELSTHHTLDLRTDGSELLSEARMMARLAHPNVVAVHEVGLAGSSLFVVMEYVAGTTLREWLATPRDPAAICAVFAQAARGLAAAHARSLVHRDFKPANVLLGDDGRVRVADFGLSQLVAARVARLDDAAGTPKYMAPEVWNGVAPTPAVDIYAFCVALAEALGADTRDALRTLRARRIAEPLARAIADGLAADPASRPSSERLAALLERSPRRSGVRVAAFVLGAAAVGVIATTSHAGESCTDLDTQWTDALRAQLDAKLASTPNGDLVARADRAAGELHTAHAAACRAHADGHITAAQRAARTSCLDRRAMWLAASMRAVLAADKPDLTVAHGWLVALRAQHCEELDEPPPVDRPAVAALYTSFATFGASPADLHALAARATELGDPELAAHAALRAGVLERNADNIPASVRTLERSHRIATAVGNRDLQAHALAERSVTALLSGDRQSAITLAQLARDLVDAHPSITAATRAAVYRALGRAELLAARHPESIALLQRALAILDENDEHAPSLELQARADLVDALLNAKREREASKLANASLERARHLFGPASRSVAFIEVQVAKAYRVLRDRERALAHARAAYAAFRAHHGDGDLNVLTSRGLVAQLLFELGHHADAITELAAVIATAEAIPSLRLNIAYWKAVHARATFEADHDAGLALFEKVIEEVVAENGTDHPTTTARRFLYADLLLEVGRLREADKAIAAIEATLAKRPDPTRHARVRGELVARLLRMRGQPVRAESVARDALAALADDGEHRLATIAVHAAALVDLGRHPDARAVLEPAIATANTRREREDTVAVLELQLARAEHGLGDRAAARSRAQRVAAVLERWPGQRAARAELAALLDSMR